MSAMKNHLHDRLEYLRSQIRAERISYGELAELQSLADFIEPGDVELAEPAGIDEAEFHARTHYCTYCDFYSRDHFTGKQVSDDVFLGTEAAVVAHAEKHPIGDPRDMAMPITDRAEYEK